MREPPPGSSASRLVAACGLVSLLTAAATAAAQGRATATGGALLQEAVGASVVADVLGGASLPVFTGTPSTGPGALSGSPPAVSAPGQSADRNERNLITVFSNGDIELISDTTVSVSVSTAGLPGLAAQAGSAASGQNGGSIVILAQFN